MMVGLVCGVLLHGQNTSRVSPMIIAFFYNNLKVGGKLYSSSF